MGDGRPREETPRVEYCATGYLGSTCGYFRGVTKYSILKLWKVGRCL